MRKIWIHTTYLIILNMNISSALEPWIKEKVFTYFNHLTKAYIAFKTQISISVSFHFYFFSSPNAHMFRKKEILLILSFILKHNLSGKRWVILTKRKKTFSKLWAKAMQFTFDIFYVNGIIIIDFHRNVNGWF